MKKLGFTIIMSMMLASFTTLLAQSQREEYLGLPGDNLNLYAVLKLFQESETLEGFERNLNDQNSTINNLDLDGDNRVDYIRVIDNVDGEVHNIILQVAITSREFQDVAVFTVIRDARGQVQIQLIGDEALYGRNYIIEPNMELSETPNPGYTGNVTIVRTTTYEIAAWPLVRFMFLPTYVVWHSPWYYGYYPHYWNPWQPFYWHYYYGYHSHWNHYYYSHYSPCNYHRYEHYNTYYSSRRAYSPHVSTRIQSGYYKTTYSRPDQRSKGEAYYNRRYSEQSTRSSGSNPSSINARRQSAGTATTQKSGSNSSSINGRRQSTGTATTQKSGSNSSSINGRRQSTGTTTTQTKSGTTTTRKSTGTTSTKQATASKSTRQTTTAGTNGSARSSSGQSSTSTRTNKKSSPAGQGASSRKSGDSSKSSTSESSRRSAN